MPPYKQTYKETFSIEKQNLSRDINILTQISENEYIFLEAKEKELQYEGVDFIGINKKEPINLEKYIFIDRKTSNKYAKREWFIFELYYQYEGGEKQKSWSLKRPYVNLDKFMIVFIDREQVVSIHKDKMINSLSALEELRPELIKVKKEVNQTGKEVKKYIVSLPINHVYFRSMKPKIYHKCYVNGLEYFKRVE